MNMEEAAVKIEHTSVNILFVVIFRACHNCNVIFVIFISL